MKFKFIIILSALALVILIHSLHSYLSLNQPIRAEILVIEGWLDYGHMSSVLKEYNKNNYKRLIVVGDSMVTHNNMTSAESKAQRLRSLSNQTINITTVQTKFVTKNQTFNYFVGFKDWLVSEYPDAETINLFTASVHARKSVLLLRRLLPKSINVGVISAAPLRYNSNLWWLSKKGIHVVVKNTISLIYAFLFEKCKYLNC
jgi:hypothetical protein